MTNEKVLVVLSGGQDSSTCLLWAVKTFPEVLTITFNYNQRHRLEIDSAQDITDYLCVPHEVIHLPMIRELTTSPLLGSAKNPNIGNLPATFIPGRNILFLTCAAMYAHKYGIHTIITGVCETDYSGYPDCREETIKSLEQTLTLGMEWKINILTPLMKLTKAESINLIKDYPEAEPVLRMTHTCYRNEFPPCGECDACKLRAKGFAEAGMEDPIFSWGEDVA